jgi:hypothetical protein
MKNPLIRSALIVFSFWFLVLYIASGAPLSIFQDAVLGALLVVAIGAAMGMTLGLASHRLIGPSESPADPPDVPVRATIMSDAKTMKIIGVPVPLPTPPKTKELPSSEIKKVIPNWPEYEKSHPAYAAVVREVLGYMMTKPKLPAAPNPGDHGGLTLIEHTANVVRAMMERAPKWRYEGMRDKKGRVTVPVQDLTKGFHAFEPGDPILIAAAVAHDVGKVDCYKQINASKPEVVEEVRDRHGEVGAAVLRKMPSVMALPYKEREALIMAVCYYHAASELPRSEWVTDRIRSLTLLLYEADCVASAQEGTSAEEKLQYAASIGAKADRSKANSNATVSGAAAANGSEPEPTRITNAQPIPVSAIAAASAARPSDEESEEESMPLPPPPKPDLSRTSPIGTGYKAPEPDRDEEPDRTEDDEGNNDTSFAPYFHLPDERPVLVAVEELVLGTPGAINGSGKERIVLYVRSAAPDGMFFINDAKLRAALGQKYGIDLMTLPNRGVMHDFTKQLNYELFLKKLLVTEHNGRQYSFKRALWKAHYADQTPAAQGVKKPASSTVIAVKGSWLPSRITDQCKVMEKIPLLEPFWGESSAINKAGKPKANSVPATSNAEADNDKPTGRIALSMKTLQQVLSKPKSPEARALGAMVSDEEGVVDVDRALQVFDFDPSQPPPGFLVRKSGDKQQLVWLNEAV